MTWATYGTFVVFAAVVVIAPGPDFAIGGAGTHSPAAASAGIFTSLGVVASCLVQGTLAAFGVGRGDRALAAAVPRIRWAGIAYLCYLGVQALLSARRGDAWAADGAAAACTARASPAAALRQGFLCNITNPKVLAFYLSVLPQFLGHAGTPTVDALALAYTHAVLGVLWLFALVAFLHRVRPWLQRRARAAQPRRAHRHRAARLRLGAGGREPLTDDDHRLRATARREPVARRRRAPR